MRRDRKIQFDHPVTARKRILKVAIGFANYRCFSNPPWFELARVGARIEIGLEWLYLDLNEFLGVLGKVGVTRKHNGDRLTDIAHILIGEDRLPERFEIVDSHHTKGYRRDFGHVLVRPNRNHAIERERSADINVYQATACDRRAYDPHV